MIFAGYVFFMFFLWFFNFCQEICLCFFLCFLYVFFMRFSMVFHVGSIFLETTRTCNVFVFLGKLLGGAGLIKNSPLKVSNCKCHSQPIVFLDQVPVACLRAIFWHQHGKLGRSGQ